MAKVSGRDRLRSIKRSRNNLIHAMSLDVATQPLVAKGTKYPESTPVWKVAPRGAYYKAKRYCSLVTDVTMFLSRNRTKVSKTLTRMSLYIWSLSKKEFDGMCRRVRSLLTYPAKLDCPNKSPEASERFGPLTENPSRKGSVQRLTRRRPCHHKSGGYTAARFSHKVGLVIESLWCTKCTATSRRNGLLHAEHDSVRA
jgi:hypothetical protein